MEILALQFADIYRDGGSFEAYFSTDDGLGYGLWLQRSSMPDKDGLHHKWLFEYRGTKKSQECIPIVTGSDDERRLIRRLESYLAAERAQRGQPEEYSHIQRLEQMLDYIRRREACFPSDLRAAGYFK